MWLWGLLKGAFAQLLFPTTQSELSIFYLFWVLLYLAANIIWDIRTSKTPAFHVTRLTQKTDIVFGATSFASSLLIIGGVVSAPTMKLAGDAMLPLLIAGMAGVLLSVGQICPYRVP